MRIHSHWAFLAAVLSLHLVAGCEPPPRGDPPPRVLQLELVPAASTLSVGQELELRVFAVFSNGEQVDVTRESEWESSDPAVVQIMNSAMEGQRVKALGGGRVFVIATWQGLSAWTSLEVRKVSPPEDPYAIFVEAAAAGPNLVLGSQLQLKAWGRYAGGSLEDLTTRVDWSSEDPELLSFDPVVPGLVTANKDVGRVRVTAILGNLKGYFEVQLRSEHDIQAFAFDSGAFVPGLRQRLGLLLHTPQPLRADDRVELWMTLTSTDGQPLQGASIWLPAEGREQTYHATFEVPAVEASPGRFRLTPEGGLPAMGTKLLSPYSEVHLATSLQLPETVDTGGAGLQPTLEVFVLRQENGSERRIRGRLSGAWLHVGEIAVDVRGLDAPLVAGQRSKITIWTRVPADFGAERRLRWYAVVHRATQEDPRALAEDVQIFHRTDEPVDVDHAGWTQAYQPDFLGRYMIDSPDGMTTGASGALTPAGASVELSILAPTAGEHLLELTLVDDGATSSAFDDVGLLDYWVHRRMVVVAP